MKGLRDYIAERTLMKVGRDPFAGKHDKYDPYQQVRRALEMSYKGFDFDSHSHVYHIAVEDSRKPGTYDVYLYAIFLDQNGKVEGRNEQILASNTDEKSARSLVVQ